MDVTKDQQEIIMRYQELVNRLKLIIENEEEKSKYYRDLYYKEKNQKLELQETLDDVRKDLFDLKVSVVTCDWDKANEIVKKENK